MDRLQNMRVFQQVAELGSFVRAAEKFEISAPMASRHVKELEQELGVRLLHRTSRRVSLTQDGQVYLESLREILDQLDAAEAMLGRSALIPRGTLRIAAPVWLQQRDFSQGLAAYQARYPEVLIDLQLADRFVDLVEESVDLALRVTGQPHDSLIARKLAPMPFVLVASPAYLKQYGRPTRAHELAAHRMVVNAGTRQGQTLPIFENGKVVQAECQIGFLTNNTHMVAQAAAAGMGIAGVPAFLLSEPALNNSLIVLSELKLAIDVSLYAVYTSRRQQSPKVRTFIDFMLEWFQRLA